MHHLDASKKEISLGGIRANPTNWRRISEELRKCILVCNNCHAEIHAGIRKIALNVRSFDESYASYKPERKKSYCPICGKEKINCNITCSRQCAGKLAGKVNWDEVDLEYYLFIQNMSYTAIGEILGVSDTAVRKRAKKLRLT